MLLVAPAPQGPCSRSTSEAYARCADGGPQRIARARPRPGRPALSPPSGTLWVRVWPSVWLSRFASRTCRELAGYSWQTLPTVSTSPVAMLVAQSYSDSNSSPPAQPTTRFAPGNACVGSGRSPRQGGRASSDLREQGFLGIAASARPRRATRSGCRLDDCRARGAKRENRAHAAAFAGHRATVAEMGSGTGWRADRPPIVSPTRFNLRPGQAECDSIRYVGAQSLHRKQ
jgi:hypothetical protein